jgi:hypothetical protein
VCLFVCGTINSSACNAICTIILYKRDTHKKKARRKTWQNSHIGHTIKDIKNENQRAACNRPYHGTARMLFLLSNDLKNVYIN